MTESLVPSRNPLVLSAMQLGWLTVETFGLLRRYARHGRPVQVEKINAWRRFNFTDRTPTLTDQILLSIERLKATAAQLAPDHPLPVEDNVTDWLVRLKADPQELQSAWVKFDQWSCDVWQMLLLKNPLAGQAFATGGDLADTYWYPQGSGVEKLAETLRSYRLSYLAELVNDLGDYLPEYVAQVLQYSLRKWSIGESVKGMNRERLMERLEAQVKVWRDLLFGQRHAVSYLTPGDQRQITWGAVAASTGLILLVGLLVWAAVLLLITVGGGVMGAVFKLPANLTQAGSSALQYVSNWENWSAIFATITSVVAILTGVIKGLSGWLWSFRQSVLRGLTVWRIQRRTYRDYRLEKKELAVSSPSSNP